MTSQQSVVSTTATTTDDEDDSCNDDDEDSILAAVSTLFTEPDNYDDNIDNSKNSNANDKVVARILPVGANQYERLKPHHRKCEASRLRELLMIRNKDDDNDTTHQESKDIFNLFGDDNHIKNDTDGVFCLLEAHVTLPSLQVLDKNGYFYHENANSDRNASNNKTCVARHCLSIHLQRHADETANRSLRRLALSIQGKFQQQERLLRDKSSNNNNNIDNKNYIHSDNSRNNSHHHHRRSSSTCTSSSLIKAITSSDVRIHTRDTNVLQSSISVPPTPATLQKESRRLSNSCHDHPQNGAEGRVSSVNDDDNKNNAVATVLVCKKERPIGHECSRCGSGSPSCDCYDYETYPLDNRIRCADLWKELSRYDDCQLHLKLSCSSYNNNNSMEERTTMTTVCMPLIACPPTIISVQTFEDFEAFVFVGVPLVVTVNAVHATHTIITWFADQEEIVCNDSNVYTPRPDDIGKLLSVLIVPVRSGHLGVGCEEAYQFQQRVQALPPMPLISPLRDAWVASSPRSERKGALRIMTYNLLADLYTTREIDQQVMYNHCPSEFLCRKRRMPMLLYELLVYQPDLICLQEVDHFIFDRLLKPCLESQGYQGFYSNKASAQLEGCAMFWSLRSFQKVELGEMETFRLRDLFRQNIRNTSVASDNSLKDIERVLADNPELSRVTCEKVGQILQVVQLRLRDPAWNQPDRVVVANTHLFYHPLAGHIRAMQSYMVARQLDLVRRCNDDNDKPCPVVLCGDLNAHPMSGAVQLLLERRVGPENHDTWKHLKEYQWDMGDHEFLLEHGFIGNDIDSGPTYEDEEFEDALESLSCTSDDMMPLELELPQSFPNLVSGYLRQMPEFTNFAVDFAETLDYILLSEASPTEAYGLVPWRSAPVLGSHEMKRYVAMPNETMPSDHVSLVCDAEWMRFDANPV